MGLVLAAAGSLQVAVIGSRRPLDGFWIALAAAGIVLLADPGVFVVLGHDLGGRELLAIGMVVVASAGAASLSHR